MTGRAVWLLVPAGVDDPARVSGGNVYDRRVREGLARLGWLVRQREIADGAQLAAALGALPRGATALIDGLVAGWGPDAVAEASARLRVVVLAHMVVAAFPGATAESRDAERGALRSAARVIATSEWTAAELVRRGLVEGGRVAVAVPGASAEAGGGAADGPGRADDLELLCVGAIAPHKGQDLLLDALAGLPGHDWRLTLAGSSAVAPEFAAEIARAAVRLGGRVRMPGPLTPPELDRAYRRCGALVAPSRVESFGMAIADARRRGIPVIAAAVGGIPEAVAGGGALLVPPGDAAALRVALNTWMSDPAERARLRAEAARASTRAPRWADTAARIDRVLAVA